jgi:hypothetical protein
MANPLSQPQCRILFFPKKLFTDELVLCAKKSNSSMVTLEFPSRLIKQVAELAVLLDKLRFGCEVREL